MSIQHAARERNYSDFIDELGLVYVKGQELSAEDLTELLHIGEGLTSQSAFLRGDAYNMVCELYGDDWINLVDFELNLRTLGNYGRVCKKFPRERRIKSKFLKFRHYDAVKGIKDPALQDELLRRADKDRLPSDELRQLANEKTATAPTQRIDKDMEVGMIDDELMYQYNLKLGVIVRVSFEIVVPEKAAA